MNWESYVAGCMSKRACGVTMRGLRRFPNRGAVAKDIIFATLESRLMEQRFVSFYGKLVSADRWPSGSRSKEMRND